MKATLIFILLSFITGWRTSDEKSVISPPGSKLPEIDSSYLLSAQPVDPEIKLNPDNVMSEYNLSNPESDMQLLMVPSIGATKSYNLFGTDNSPVGPSPGDTLEYTVTISNSPGAMDAPGVKFSDMIDPNTTLVAGSLNTSPIAVDDSYSTVGNVSISVPMASGLLVNDIELDGDMITVTLSMSRVPRVM